MNAETPETSEPKTALTVLLAVLGCLGILVVFLLLLGAAIVVAFGLWPPSTAFGVALRFPLIAAVLFCLAYLSAGHAIAESCIGAIIAAIIFGIIGFIVGSRILSVVSEAP